MTTVTAVKRALEEAAIECEGLAKPVFAEAFVMLSCSPTATTILANRLSDRGEAGNKAAEANLKSLRNLAGFCLGEPQAALEWAIDQLTPPERAQP